MGVYYVIVSWVTYHEHCVIRSFPLGRRKGSSPRTNDLTRPPAVTGRKKERRIKAVPWLSVAQVVSGMVYSVVANRRQPSPKIIGGGGEHSEQKRRHTSLGIFSTLPVSVSSRKPWKLVRVHRRTRWYTYYCTGDLSPHDLWYTQKPIYLPIFSNNIRSLVFTKVPRNNSA